MKGWSRSRRRGREVVFERMELWPRLMRLENRGGGVSKGWRGGCVGRGRREGGRECTYERKVDLPHSGSPSRRIVTVGGSSINLLWWMRLSLHDETGGLRAWGGPPRSWRRSPSQ